jgi:hypothetical protein
MHRADRASFLPSFAGRLRESEDAAPALVSVVDGGVIDAVARIR